MTKFYSAIFTEKKTGKVIYRLDYKCLFDRRNTEEQNKSMNKFLWEKEKAVRLEKLIKDKFYEKGEIAISEHEGVI